MNPNERSQPRSYFKYKNKGYTLEELKILMNKDINCAKLSVPITREHYFELFKDHINEVIGPNEDNTFEEDNSKKR